MYKIFKLSFLFQDLEPFIDTHTNGLHYYKHAMNYLNNLNKILNKNNYDYRYKLEELLFHVNEFPLDDRDNILFNLGGVLNHELYFKSIGFSNSMPNSLLMESINRKYGSYDEFWNKFKEAALNLKGSGYTFLVLKKDGSIDIMNVANQGNPLIYGYIPLINIDLWEHAYYINYQNDKARYIDNFKNIVDFTNANYIFNSMSK